MILYSFSNDWRVRLDSLLIPYLGKDWKSNMLKVGEPAPNVLLGKRIINSSGEGWLSDYNNKILILDFWSTWCSSCMASLPRMAALQKKFWRKNTDNPYKYLAN